MLLRSRLLDVMTLGLATDGHDSYSIDAELAGLAGRWNVYGAQTTAGAGCPSPPIPVLASLERCFSRSTPVRSLRAIDRRLGDLLPTMSR